MTPATPATSTLQTASETRGWRLEIAAVALAIMALTGALWMRYGDEAFVATLVSGLMTCF